MTEMTVSLAAIAPLFLLIPLLGKYTDIKHATIEAARYQAWEYTVWYAARRDRPAGYRERQPVKPLGQTRREARRRFLSNTRLLLRNTDSSGWSQDRANPLWVDHRRRPLYRGGGEAGSRQSGPLATPDFSGSAIANSLGNLRTFAAGMRDVVSAGVGLGGGSSGSFTGVRDGGLYTTAIQLPVQTGAAFRRRRAFRSGPVPAPQNLRFSGQAAVLADGWNAGSRRYALEQFRNISITGLLNDSAMQAIGSSVISMLAVPELANDSLIWGYPLRGDTDANFPRADLVHPDRLSAANSSAGAPYSGLQYKGQSCGPGGSFFGGWRGPGLCRFTK